MWKCALVGSNSHRISLVDVPQRIGTRSKTPLTPMDLDVFLWIALPESRVTTILDVNANQLSVMQFPFDGPDILDGIYTFYFHEQVRQHNILWQHCLMLTNPGSKRKLGSEVNNLAALLTNDKAAPWYGDILVIKQDKLGHQVVNVNEMDIAVICRILRRYTVRSKCFDQCLTFNV